MVVPEVPSVQSMTARLRELLKRARRVKKAEGIEPPLPVLDFVSNGAILAPVEPAYQQAHNAVAETASRRLFHDIIASVPIEQPAFVQVWDLFDILSVCGDHGECEPVLVFWLVEELLDSQSIDGCRLVFDYLESRRERMIANHWGKKALVVLRSCNELLRRLSRAEDAVFCGRVFIYLFQSFPLGDKSSVNLRGEFHVENVTTFESPRPSPADGTNAMDVDAQQGVNATESSEGKESTEKVSIDGQAESSRLAAGSIQITLSETDSDGQEDTSDDDKLYPIFWSLQQAFSNPPSLFSQDRLQEFKSGLEATIKGFKEVPKVIQAKTLEGKRGVKRKYDERHDDFATTFNPKYLTSRDLFKLELSDLAFQRHILVQALILIDFLLSLTERSKKKLSHLNTQKALQYNFTLNEQDTEWALSTRNAIAAYLQEGPDGKFYYRMVDTVLARDKNWVRWKMESCPPIARQPVSAETFVDAKTGLQRACANKRLRATPMGSLDLKFLSDAENANGLEMLKDPNRYSVPTAESLARSAAGDELDLEMATSEEEKQMLQDAVASKTWRMLRIASKSKLGFFEKIDDGKRLHDLLQPDAAEEAPRDEGVVVAPEVQGQQLDG